MRQPLLILMLSLLLPFTGRAQEVDTLWLAIEDSTRQKIENLTPIERVRTLVVDGWGVHEKAPERSLIYAKVAERDTGLVDNPIVVDSLYRLMAFSYGDINNRTATLRSHLMRLRVLSTMEEDTRARASANFETAGLHMNMGNPQLALPYYEECARISQAIDYKTQHAQALIEIATILHDNGEDVQAIANLIQAEEIFGEFPRFAFMVGFIKINRAQVYSDLEQDSTARLLVKEALTYVDTSQYLEYTGLIYSGAASIMLQQGFYQESLPLFNEARAIFENYNKMFYLPKVYREMSEAYEDINLDSSFHYLSKFVLINDSVLTEQNSRKIAELQLAYQDEKQQQQIKILEEQGKVAEAESSRKSQILKISLGALVLVVILLFFLINLVRTTRKQSRLVGIQKKMVESRNREIEDSISYAKRIQDAMMPEFPQLQAWMPESFVLYLPKDKLSGDFFWCDEVHTNQDQNLKVFAVADCTGHGVPGALLSILGITYLRLGAVESSVNSPATALDFLNQGVNSIFASSREVIRDGMDISLGAIDLNTMTLIYASAKNPLYVVRNGEVHVLEKDKQAIGKEKNEAPYPFTDHKFALEKGDVIYATSDGYQDQFGGPKGKKFKLAKLRSTLVSISGLPMAEQQKQLFDLFEEWRGPLEQIDDVTVMGVRV